MRGKSGTASRHEYLLVPVEDDDDDDVERASAQILADEDSEMQSKAYTRVLDVYSRICSPQSADL